MTLEERYAELGDPRPFMFQNGTVQWGWESKIVTQAALPAPLPLSWDATQKVTHFKCHRRLRHAFEDVLAAVHAEADLWATINDFGGCYEFRAERRSKLLSAHSWAAAIDLDVGDNAFRAAPHVDPRVVAIFNAHGFVWGGTFPPDRVDGQHFEASYELVIGLP